MKLDDRPSFASRQSRIAHRTEAHAALVGAMEAWDEPWASALAHDLSISCQLDEIDTGQAIALVKEIRRLLDVLDRTRNVRDCYSTQRYDGQSLAILPDATDGPSVNRTELAASL